MEDEVARMCSGKNFLMIALHRFDTEGRCQSRHAPAAPKQSMLFALIYPLSSDRSVYSCFALLSFSFLQANLMRVCSFTMQWLPTVAFELGGDGLVVCVCDSYCSLV